MRIRYVLLAAALAWPLAGQAQDAPAVSAAKAHFQSTARYASADVAELSVVDSYLDRRTGATHVYLSQRHNGVDVFGTTSAAAVVGERVFASGDAFQADLAARANASTPNLAAASAEQIAEAHARALTPSLADRAIRAVTDDPALDVIPSVSYEVLNSAQLVYETVPGDALRLAWAIELRGDGGPTGQQLWSIRVDALTGSVLAADDLITYERLSSTEESAHGHSPVDLTVPAAALPFASTALAGSYRVVPMPFESPNHGTFQLVANPDDADASPFGWHDTNGAAGNETTNTSGANVNAYTDTDANNAPDAGSQPDGGAGLVFDIPFDDSLTPQQNADAAVVSVFYWSNIVHDVLWQYGFDEPSGNFQTNNYGRGGSQNDAVQAEALDGSGTNNANFGTPGDGASPRMQMFEWTAVPVVTVTEPAAIAGQYPAGGAAFGPTDVATYLGEMVRGDSPEGTGDLGCEGVVDAVAGKIAIIQRGGCAFVDKVRSAQTAGAIAAVVYNCQVGETDFDCSEDVDSDNVLSMGGDANDITIPSAFVGRTTGLTLIANIPETEITMDYGQSRDSDFDAGVIAHEIGHGVSTRLTGGRFTSCLGNQEQMGEGWSDYIGMMLTMQATDTGAQPRGVGTYVSFEAVDGQGIRPTPYSTDFAVNDVSYDDVINNASAGLSVPHGIGYAWASMLWDMTWAMVEADGFGDIYDADGTAGNQKALQLVIEAMKLQPCSPGFVDGRDAIFAADALLYDNAHYEMIGEAFASRGLGFNADQGSSASLGDGTADFTPFPLIATETDAAGRVTELAVRGANPFRTETSVEISVGTPQEVTVDVIDLLGRRVATLFSGEMSADSAKRLSVSADGLPSGVYIVRATGETFSLTERITITR